MIESVRVRRLLVALALIPVGVLAACGGGGGSGESSDTIKLTLGAGHPEGALTYTTHSHAFLVPEIEKRVKEETNYSIEIDEQYGGTVTPVGEVLEGVQSGIVDIGLVPYQFEASTLPVFNFSNYVPFGSPDIDVVLKAGRAAIFDNKEAISFLDERYNQKPLAFLPVGDYNMATNFPIDDPSDVKGKKITGAGPNLNWVKPLGAIPVQGNLNDWYNGIQTGLYDGAIIFLDAYAGFKLNEVAKYYTKTHFGSVFAGGLHVNNQSWEQLPKEVQKVISDVALEWEQGFSDAVAKDNQKALKTLKGTDAKITVLSDEARKEWAESLPNFPAQFIKDNKDSPIPADKVMKTYLKTMTEEGYEFPRTWDLD